MMQVTPTDRVLQKMVPLVTQKTAFYEINLVWEFFLLLLSLIFKNDDSFSIVVENDYHLNSSESELNERLVKLIIVV